MSKFDELKKRAEHAKKERLYMGMLAEEILELLSIQAQLVEALQLMLNTGGSYGKRVEAVNKTNAALAAVGAQP